MSKKADKAVEIPAETPAPVDEPTVGAMQNQEPDVPRTPLEMLVLLVGLVDAGKIDADGMLVVFTKKVQEGTLCAVHNVGVDPERFAAARVMLDVERKRIFDLYYGSAGSPLLQ